jgi:hypothetical protein
MDNEGVYVSVSQEKWAKAKKMVNDTATEVDESKAWLKYKRLESGCGFLLYVRRTYPSMMPYLKGFHLTLDGWRRGRDNDGWKYLSQKAREAQDQGELTGIEDAPNAPKQVKAKARLIHTDTLELGSVIGRAWGGWHAEGANVFIFKDNSMAKAMFYRGNSSSKMLFKLMLQL